MLFYYYVNTTIHYPVITGIQRVTCGIGHSLYLSGHKIIPVTYDPHINDLRLLTSHEIDKLNKKYATPLWSQRPQRKDTLDYDADFFIVTEIAAYYANETNYIKMLRTVKSHHMLLAVIYHDDVTVEARHIKHYDTNYRQFIEYYIYQLFRFSDYIFPVSQYQATRLIKIHWSNFSKRYPDYKNKMPVIIPILNAVHSKLIDTANTMTIDPPYEQPFHIIYVSTIEPRKNHIPLIRAIKLLNERTDITCHLHLVGTRFDCWKEYLNKVDQEIGNCPYIHIYNGIPDEELKTIYHQCHLSVYMSITEGFGLPIIESLTMKLPCVHLPSSSMKEISVKGCDTVDVTDTPAIFLKFYNLLSHPQVLKEMKKCVSGYQIRTWNMYTKELLEHLQSK